MGIRKRSLAKGALWLLSAFLMLAVVQTKTTSAAQRNTILIGGDYRIFSLPEGSSDSACRNECRDDPQCRAWTFIKQRVRTREGLNFNLGPDVSIGLGGRTEVIPPQCRLKRTIGRSSANSCCTSGEKKRVARGRRGKEDRCADYADDAVNRNEKNLIKRCGLRGGHWHDNYRRHYKWCMGKPGPRHQKVADRLDDKLRSCAPPRRNRFCTKYADTALNILEQFKDNDCQDGSESMRNNYDDLYDWCVRRKSKTTVDSTLSKAQIRLTSCLKRGGGPRIAACEKYTENALNTISDSSIEGCRFNGRIWQNNYKSQYKLCRDSNSRKRERQETRRSNMLSRCSADLEASRRSFSVLKSLYVIGNGGLTRLHDSKGRAREIGGGEWLRGPMAMTSLNNALYIIAHEKLWKINPRTGKWRQLGKGKWGKGPTAITSLNGSLYIITHGKLWRANANSGLWRQLGKGKWGIGRVAITSLNGYLYAVSGGKLWRASPNSGSWKQLGTNVWGKGPTAMTSLGKKLYIISHGKLWKVNASNGGWASIGRKNWNRGPAAITTHNGYLYIVQGGTLYRVNSTNGRHVVVGDIRGRMSYAGIASIKN